MENNVSKNRDGARIIAGLILVGVGVAYLLRNTGFLLPHWLFTWPMILILVGIYSGVKNNFHNHTWIILIIIGGIFLAGNFYPEVDFDRAIWPVAIIAFGLLFILRPKRRDSIEKKNLTAQYNTEYIDANTKTKDQTDSSDFIRVNSVFSGVAKNMMSKNFQGGKIICIFGGADVDFMQADINGTVVIKIELIFGGAKIVIPANWTVVNQIDGMFHGVDDKRKNTIVLPDPTKVLILKGSAMFGGVDIRSY